MGNMKAIHIYVASVSVLGVLAASLASWDTLFLLSSSELWGLLALIVIGVGSESLAVSVSVGRDSGTTSITFLPLLACVILFGPVGALFFAIIVNFAAEFLIRRKEFRKAFFNLAQWVVATSVAGFAYELAGGTSLVFAPQESSGLLLSQFGPFVAFALTFVLINYSAVSIAVSLSQDISIREVLSGFIGGPTTNIFYDLLVSPIAIAVAFFYLELGLIGLLVTLLPLLFIRHAYQTKFHLESANEDLLKALVKAIETRDPYTSGHSLRVSYLARKIALDLGLRRNDVENVEKAALLHDIGKIDSIYSEILRKPGRLTDDEMDVIKSHVEKGVDLLQSLSSLNRDVIDAVKYHHERVDGRGYPFGISGDEIPIGAKIIKVCDAVDAMMSDRPYRDALEVSTVKEQLETYVGSQFDGEVVWRVLDSDILEEHSRTVELSSELGTTEEDRMVRSLVGK